MMFLLFFGIMISVLFGVVVYSKIRKTSRAQFTLINNDLEIDDMDTIDAMNKIATDSDVSSSISRTKEI